MESAPVPARRDGLDDTWVQRGRPPGSPSYFALLFAPPAQQASLTALFALQAEIQSAAQTPGDHGVAHTRLDWWRGEIERLAAGAPVHPISRELAAHQQVDFAPLGQLVTDAQWELARLTLETAEEFQAACWRSHGVVQWIGMQLAGVSAGDAEPFARDLGVALALERTLLALRSAVTRGSVRLPLAELNERGITLEDLREKQPPAPLAAYVEEVCEQTSQRLRSGIEALQAPLRSALRAHIVLAGLSRAQLGRIARAARRAEDFQQESSALQRLWTAWRAARSTPPAV
jgi:phytoene synthase